MSNIDWIFEAKHSAKRPDHDREKNNYIHVLFMVKQIYMWCIHVIAATFFNKNVHCCFCFWVLQFYFNPLTPMQAVTSLGLLTSSLLPKISIISTSPGGKDFPNNTQIRELSLMAPEIRTKSWVKNSEQNFLPLHMVKFAYLDDAFFEVF